MSLFPTKTKFSKHSNSKTLLQGVPCIRCGQLGTADQDCTWRLCSKCVQDFLHLTPDKVIEWYQGAVDKYLKTRKRSFYSFAKFLETYVPLKVRVDLGELRKRKGNNEEKQQTACLF